MNVSSSFYNYFTRNLHSGYLLKRTVVQEVSGKTICYAPEVIKFDLAPVIRPPLLIRPILFDPLVNASRIGSTVHTK